MIWLIPVGAAVVFGGVAYHKRLDLKMPVRVKAAVKAALKATDATRANPTELRRFSAELLSLKYTRSAKAVLARAVAIEKKGGRS